MDLKEIRYDCVDWDQLALDRDKWRALVKMVMNLRVYEKWEIFEQLRNYCLLEKESVDWSSAVGWLVGWLVS
jgi:hypothetical protein